MTSSSINIPNIQHPINPSTLTQYQITLLREACLHITKDHVEAAKNRPRTLKNTLSNHISVYLKARRSVGEKIHSLIIPFHLFIKLSNNEE